MKSTGVVRKIDDLGRAVLPKEMRKTLRLEAGDGLEIFTQDDQIIFRKWEISCVFCGSQDNLKTFSEKKICGKCRKKILQNEQNEQNERDV